MYYHHNHHQSHQQHYSPLQYGRTVAPHPPVNRLGQQSPSTCCQSRLACTCPPPQEQPRYCVCGRHGKRLMQPQEPRCPCEAWGQRHEHRPLWKVDPDDCEDARIKRHIIQYKICKERELQNIRKEEEQYQCRPILKDRWLTEHRDQFRYYINRCALHDNCAANCEVGCSGSNHIANLPPCAYGSCFQEFDSAKMGTSRHPVGNYPPHFGHPYPNVPAHGVPFDAWATQHQPSGPKVGRHNPAQQPIPTADRDSIEDDGDDQSRDNNSATTKREISNRFKKSMSSKEWRRKSGARPPFHNYGHNNQHPVHPDDYMKTFNINPPEQEVYPYLEARRERTSNYDEWKKFIKYPDPKVGKETVAKKSQHGTRPRSRTRSGSQRMAAKVREPETTAYEQETSSGFDPSGSSVAAAGQVDWTGHEQNPTAQHTNYNQQQQHHSGYFHQNPAHLQQHYTTSRPQLSNQNWPHQPSSYHDIHSGNPPQAAGPMQQREHFSVATSTTSTRLGQSDNGCRHNVSEFVNFEPCQRPEMQPRNYKGLPPSFTQYIVPAGKRIPVSTPAGECFKMFD